ncbi:MAG TPA: Holliday junction resolvase RuvX [Bacteroidales bacterium]|nr:Holliday junction resolvase RuvX [Bacteroidales bacterium]HRZ47810.1 Holliday junction resolvase RuvX [Bacteroidales bacterium]
MGRILALDIGQKRIGLAVTDPLQMIAGALDTVPVHHIWDFLTAYIQTNEVSKILIGWPLQSTGAESESMRYVKPFYNRCKKLFPEIEVITWDERFTSVMAKSAILQSGVNRKTRHDKALVDKISATILLQSYLESAISN